MRQLVTLFALFITLFSFAQVSLELDNVPVSDAIHQFSQASGYRFAYNPDILNQRTLTASLENVPLEKAVDQVFADDYNYKIRGSYVILLPKKEAVGSSERVKPITIKGEIVEAGTNKKLENVSIYEIHTLKPVLTDASGDYSLDVNLPDDIAFIAITKENYEDTIIQVKRNSEWTIALKRKSAEVEDLLKEKIFSVFNSPTMKTHTKNVNLTERRWAHLALTPGISTNGFLSGKFTNKFSVNLIAGYSHALEGVELGGVLNMERSYVEGVQMSGAVNINGDYTDGVQMAGMSNVTIGWVKGLQMGGFSNHCGDLDGWQLAGAINTTTNGKGNQLAGSINWNTGTFQGVQASGLLNYTKTLKGLQIGVFNLADSIASGAMIGVLNLSKNGIHHFELSTNDVTPYNLSFRSGIYKFYTVLHAGINPHSANLWDYGMGFGSYHTIKNKASIDFEGTTHTLQPLDRTIDGFNMDLRFKIRFGYRFTKYLEVIGGPILHYYWLDVQNAEDELFADRFGKNAFSSSHFGDVLSKSWIGFELAVRY
ncbi:MAG: hypothetical protein CMB80_07010 [Flammeovirgaceae bacterium]|nr:hypothetical protein [Flammeovirgaceae bacterium]MBE63869.1 hypothetical protein [Flammeovirgaceae bacterium]HCX20779.1 hypothetical protein [Cytophagales bacterium]